MYLDIPPRQSRDDVRTQSSLPRSFPCDRGLAPVMYREKKKSIEMCVKTHIEFCARTIITDNYAPADEAWVENSRGHTFL